MTIRVVVLAEGPAELGVASSKPAAGQALRDVELGAAHVLIQRTLLLIDSARFAQLQFEEPPRLMTGLVPRGSDLLRRKSLRRLLTWAHPSRRPDLAVVLLDEDGETERWSAAKAHVEGLLPPPIVIGVAVREFESWLICDPKTVGAPQQPQAPESMKPGEAKRLLSQWTQAVAAESKVYALHREFAKRLRLDLVADASSSFRRFRDELAHAAKLIV